MEVITNEARENKHLNLDLFYNVEEVVVFDIETTGFTANTTTLYLIGASYYKCGKWFITQWFNDDGNSEEEIIKTFLDFVKPYKIIFHYNGDGFDLPYIDKKCELLKINNSIKELESVDLYKCIKPFKEILHLDNLKQKSVERFLNINRLDKYSGGDLIKIFSEYLDKHDNARKKLLLQHNYEDIEGFLYCCCFLGYVKLKEGLFEVKSLSVRKNKLVFLLQFDYPLPKRVSFGYDGLIFSGYQREGTLSVPIYSGEIKFFFDNYKEYYYLPAEDIAVHKSVSTYVDKNYRVPAKKETCYQKKTGHFITQLDSNIISGYKFKCKDKISYIELVDSFLKDLELLNSYARNIVRKIM